MLEKLSIGVITAASLLAGGIVLTFTIINLINAKADAQETSTRFDRMEGYFLKIEGRLSRTEGKIDFIVDKVK